MHRRLTNPKFHVSFSPINPRTLSRVLVTAHQKVRAMAFFRKAGNILSRTVSNHISQEISSSQPSIFLFQAIRCMSTSKLFIGGLSYSTDDSGLREAFSKYGEVADAKVIVDRDTGRSRGFGFVTFSTVEDATAAIQALDEQDLHGRRVRVAYANERTRGYGGGGGFGSGGYGGNYGNDGGFGGNYGGGGSGGGYGGNYGSGGGGGYGGNYRSGGGGGGYGGNFGSGGRGGAGYGGNFDNAAGGEDGYTGGGNLSHSGGQNFGGPVGGSGGSYASNASYGGGDLPGSDGQNFGVAGGGGGTDNSFVSSEVGQFKFDAEESKSTEGAADGYSQDEPEEGNYRDDDDTPNNYADRRG